MGIQNRWRLNSYDGRSTTKLPAGILQTVVELITSAKGLFSLLNRFVGWDLYEVLLLFYLETHAFFAHLKLMLVDWNHVEPFQKNALVYALLPALSLFAVFHFINHYKISY